MLAAYCRLFGCKLSLGGWDVGVLVLLQLATEAQPLCRGSSTNGAGSARLVVIPPGVLRVEYAVARGATRRHELQVPSPRSTYTYYYSLPPRPRPPHDRWRRCGAPRTVFSPASAFPRTDTPEDPAVLRPSYRHANPPKDFKPHEELDLSPNRPTRLRAELDRVHVESHTIQLQYASKRVFCDKR